MILVSVQADACISLLRLACGCFELTVSANGATVVLGTLNRAAPALSLPITRGERRDSLAVDLDGLCVVSTGIVEFVCT